MHSEILTENHMRIRLENSDNSIEYDGETNTLIIGPGMEQSLSIEGLLIQALTDAKHALGGREDRALRLRRNEYVNTRISEEAEVLINALRHRILRQIQTQTLAPALHFQDDYVRAYEEAFNALAEAATMPTPDQLQMAGSGVERLLRTIFVMTPETIALFNLSGSTIGVSG